MNQLLRTALLGLILFVANISFGQLDLAWYHHIEGDDDNVEWEMVLDGNDNAIVVGAWKGTADFDPGPNTEVLTATGTSHDIFVSKIDPNGNLVWVETFGGIGEDHAFACDVDQSGNVYVTGTYNGVFDWEPGGGVSNGGIFGLSDIFILKLDANGTFQWVETLGGAGIDQGRRVAVDNSNNIFVTGHFDGTPDFDTSPAFNYIPTNGGSDVFIMKLNPLGQTIWANTIGSTQDDFSYALDTDMSGNVVFAGTFEGAMDPDPNGGSTVSPTGIQDVFVTKLNPTGGTLWAHTFGGNGENLINDLCIDVSGSIYMTGSFEDQVDFDVSGTPHQLNSQGDFDAYVVKWYANASFADFVQFTGGDDVRGYAVSVANDGSILCTGSFEGDADLDPGQNDSNSSSLGASFDWYYTKLRSNFTSKWIVTAGGTDLDKPGDMYEDSGENIRMSGTFRVGTNINPGGAQILTANVGDDHLVAKWIQCQDADTTMLVTECTSYTSPSGKTWTSTGTYYDTIPTIGGCDSLLTIELQILGNPNVDAGFDLNVCEGDTVILNGTGADTYQWPQGITNGVPFFPPVGVNVYHVIGSSSLGCQAVDSVIVTVNANPDFPVSPDQYFCVGEQVNLSASGVQTYIWDYGASTTADYSLYPNGDTIVSVIGEDINGCTKEKLIVITLDDPANVDAGLPQTVCPGYDFTLTGSGGGDYYWDGPEVDIDFEQSITVNTDSTAYYYLTVKTVNDCWYEDSVLVTVDNTQICDLVTWNSFSPNNDGVNDDFIILGVEQYPDNQFAVFNRWGDPVRIIDNYNNADQIWHGFSDNGKELPAGTYYYVLTVEFAGPITLSLKGWVQIVK